MLIDLDDTFMENLSNSARGGRDKSNVVKIALLLINFVKINLGICKDDLIQWIDEQFQINNS